MDDKRVLWSDWTCKVRELHRTGKNMHRHGGIHLAQFCYWSTYIWITFQYKFCVWIHIGQVFGKAVRFLICRFWFAFFPTVATRQVWSDLTFLFALFLFALCSLCPNRTQTPATWTGSLSSWTGRWGRSSDGSDTAGTRTSPARTPSSARACECSLRCARRVAHLWLLGGALGLILGRLGAAGCHRDVNMLGCWEYIWMMYFGVRMTKRHLVCLFFHH